MELVLAPCYWKGCHCSGLQKQKLKRKTKCIKIPSVTLCTQPVSTTKKKNGWEDKKGRQSVLLWRSSYGRLNLLNFPSLEAEKFIWQNFLSIPVLLMCSACKFITAQQFGWWKGRRRRSERRKERRWRSSRASPASPGTCPGRQLQLLLWGKSQLSLATSRLLQGSSSRSSPLFSNLLFNSSDLIFLFFAGLFSICKSCKLLSSN